MLYVNHTVTTKQKPIVDTKIKMRKEPKYNTKESHQTVREEKKKETERSYITSQKTIKVTISKYLSIITLNVNRLYAPIKRQRVTE